MEDVSKGDQITDLVMEDRVHRRVFVDPAIFELEMTRIFERAWIYVCHDSQIPEAGDFFTTTIGRQPVICVRHADDRVYVLHNRCGHRGALVCNHDQGNTGKRFRCPYHGWSFETNGDLHAVPARQGYGNGYDLGGEEFGLVRIPHVATYRGFVFAAMDTEAPAFDLPAAMRACIDAICDRAPDGEIEVTGGVHKYEFRGNWKAQVENILDHYHPAFSHESTMNADGRQFERSVGEEAGTAIFDRQGGVSEWDAAEISTFEHGHGYQGPMPGSDKAKSGALFEQYKAALSAKHAPARVEEILGNEFYHNAVFYPNMFIQLRALFIRVIRPIAVNHTDVRVYPIKLKGAPDEMFEKQIQFLNMTHSAGSLIQTDDMEMFRRVQGGLKNSGAEWIVLGRGRHLEHPAGDGLRAPGTSELSMRSQYRAWCNYMSVAE
jgi:benzoate/toluate 1,2-dioxygenase alpha subunit